MSRMFDGRIRTYTFTLAGGETFRVFGFGYLESLQGEYWEIHNVLVVCTTGISSNSGG
jgi:hypothetical protein